MTAEASNVAAAAGPRDGFMSVLRLPPFRWFVLGQTVSQLGDKLHHMALIALVGAASTVGSGGLALAQLAVVFTAPAILLGPVAGVLVDRWNKRKTLVLCDLMRAVLVLMMPLAYGATRRLWLVYVLAFLVAMLGVFFNAAKMAIIPELVVRGQLLSANAALAFIGRFATVIGIVGGGLIVGWAFWSRIGWIGYEAGFYLDALSYFTSVVTLIIVARRMGHPEVVAGARATASPVPLSERIRQVFRSLVHDLGSTIRSIRGDARLRFVLLSVLLLALIASTIYVVMIVAVQTVMNRGTEGVGISGGVLAGGMIVGSLLVGTLGTRWDKRRTVMLGCAALGAIMVLSAIFFTFVAFVPLAFVGGLALAPVMVSQDTLLHEAAPIGKRAMIFTTRDLVLGAAFTLLALIIGGAVRVVVAIGVDEPYRMAMFVLGGIVVVAGLVGAMLARGGEGQERVSAGS